MSFNRSSGRGCRLVLGALLLHGLPAAPAGAACRANVDPVAFGVVDLRRTTLANGAVTITCDRPTSFTVGLAAGRGGGDHFLTGPANQFMPYKLFRDPTYTIEWGDGVSNAPGVSATSDGQRPTRLTIYGALPAQGGFTAGLYRDSLLVTVVF